MVGRGGDWMSKFHICVVSVGLVKMQFEEAKLPIYIHCLYPQDKQQQVFYPDIYMTGHLYSSKYLTIDFEV